EKSPLLAQAPRGGGAAPIYPNAFVHIGADDIVTLTVHKPENGQGTETSIAMLLAEDLECDWKKVRTEFEVFRQQHCNRGFGSLSVFGFVNGQGTETSIAMLLAEDLECD